jgi:hypothetical protein
MPIRRLALDVDKVVDRPSMIDLAQAIAAVPGVDAVNVTATDIDIETVGTDITVEGEDIDAETLFEVINSAGAVLHSVDEVVVGSRIIERVVRIR